MAGAESVTIRGRDRATCWLKQRFATRGEAKKHITGVRRAGRIVNTGEMKPYPCHVCGGYHITSGSKTVAQAKKIFRRSL